MAFRPKFIQVFAIAMLAVSSRSSALETLELDSDFSGRISLLGCTGELFFLGQVRRDFDFFGVHASAVGSNAMKGYRTRRTRMVVDGTFGKQVGARNGDEVGLVFDQLNLQALTQPGAEIKVRIEATLDDGKGGHPKCVDDVVVKMAPVRGATVYQPADVALPPS